MLVAVLPLLLFGTGAAWRVIELKKESVAQQLANTAHALQVAVDRELLGELELMQLLATDASLDQGHLDAFSDRARRALQTHSEWRNAVLVDSKTQLIVASALPMPSVQTSTAWPVEVASVAQTHTPYLAGVLASGKIVKVPSIHFLAPILRKGEVPWILVVSMDPKPFNGILAAQRIPSTWTGAILDKNLLIAGRSREPQLFVGKRATPTLANRILASESGMFPALNQEGQTVYTVFSRSTRTGWSVALGVPALEVDGPIQRIVLLWGTAGSVLIGLALVTTAWVGRGILRSRAEYEAALRDSRASAQTALNDFDDLVRCLPVGVYRYRMLAAGGHRFDFVSERMCTQIGARQADVLRDPECAFVCIHPLDLPDLIRANAVARETLQAFCWEGRVALPSGQRWLRMESSASKLPNGDILWNGTQQDITERRGAEQAVRNLSAAVVQSPATVVITDVNANIEYVNPRFTQVTGYTAAEVIGKNPRILQSKLTPASTYLALWEKITQGQVWQGELVNQRKNGEQYWEEAHIAPIKNAQGATTHYVAVKVDITERIRTAEKMANLVREQQAILNNELVGIVTVREHKILWANPAYAHMLGYETEELVDMPTRQLYISDAKYKAASAAVYGVLEKGNSYRSRLEQVRKDGQTIWVDVSAATMNPSTGETLWGFIDITQRVQAEELLQQSEARIRSIFEGAADAMFIADQTGHYQYVNQAAANMMGYSRDALLQMGIADLTPKEDLSGIWEEFKQLLTTGTLRSELRLCTRGGALIPVDFHGNVLPDGNLLGVCRDVSQRKQMEDQVRQLAFYDNLTNLANRRLFDDRLSQAILSGKRSGSFAALMFLDLDNFKTLNDVHGHKAGDLLLIEAAKRMKACVRETDTVARFGGDEFVVLLVDLAGDQTTSVSEAARVAEKIRVSIDQAFELTLPAELDAPTRIARHHCTVSIGVAMIAANEVAAEDALRWADKAMYEAKEHGRNQVCFSQMGPDPMP